MKLNSTNSDEAGKNKNHTPLGIFLNNNCSYQFNYTSAFKVFIHVIGASASVFHSYIINFHVGFGASFCCFTFTFSEHGHVYRNKTATQKTTNERPKPQIEPQNMALWFWYIWGTRCGFFSLICTATTTATASAITKPKTANRNPLIGLWLTIL